MTELFHPVPSPDAVHVLTAWLRSLRLKLSAALAGGPCHPTHSLNHFGGIMPANLQPLIDEITQTSTVIDSAVVFINGVPGLIAAAVSQALANGATADELKPVTDLGDTLKAKADALKAAMEANSPPG